MNGKSFSFRVVEVWEHELLDDPLLAKASHALVLRGKGDAIRPLREGLLFHPLTCAALN